MKIDKALLCCIGLGMVSLAGGAHGQTCDSAIIPTSPDNRYQNNGDGTVSDLFTGLMWQQCSVGLSGSDCLVGSVSSYTWDQALQYPQTLNTTGGFAGYDDWRLPNVKELESLAEEACVDPAINLTLFPNTLSSLYWSSSPNANQSGLTWYVYFYDGGAHHGNLRYWEYHVRLVRSNP